MTYALLFGAILAEVVGTVSLQLSEGFTRPAFTAGSVGGYLAAFALLGVVLDRGLPVAVAYAIWSASGVALVALAGTLVLDQRLAPVQLAGLAVIVVGVVVVEVGGAGR